ncbi:MAG: creatininase family protein [Thermomicrobiales bacterium]
MKPYRMAAMFWPEVDAARASVDGVLIPVGSFEQHGPMTPFEVDTVIAEHICCRAAERVQDLDAYYLVGPTINLGASWYHMDFPGTVSLDGDLFVQVVRAVHRSLHTHGFGNIIFLNGHGGNIAPLNHAINLIRAETDAPVYHVTYADLVPDLTAQTGDCLIHAGEVETSICLAVGIRVDMARAVSEANGRRAALERTGVRTSRHIRYDALDRGPGGQLPAHRIAEISASGVVGDATRANASLGEAVIEATIARLAELCADIASPRLVRSSAQSKSDLAFLE